MGWEGTFTAIDMGFFSSEYDVYYIQDSVYIYFGSTFSGRTFNIYSIFIKVQIQLYFFPVSSIICRESNGNPLQYSCMENPMDGGTWQAAVHGVTKSQACLSDFPFTFHFHTLEKEMATHSSVLAWRIPGTEEPNGLPSMG